MLNVSLGGTLIQHLPDVGFRDHWQAPPGSDTQHEVLIEKGSRLSMIYGSEKLHVNSFHHQGLRDLGDGLRAVAVAHDGLIEGIEWGRDDRWVVGMQWHAELMLDGHAGHRRLFQALVAAAASARRQPRARGRDRARGGADAT